MMSCDAGSSLVVKVIAEMINEGVDEVSLEAETTNHGALRLYEKLGFLRDKRLQRYYLSGQDAFRLKLRIKSIAQPLSDGSDNDEDGNIDT